MSALELLAQAEKELHRTVRQTLHTVSGTNNMRQTYKQCIEILQDDWDALRAELQRDSGVPRAALDELHAFDHAELRTQSTCPCMDSNCDEPQEVKP